MHQGHVDMAVYTRIKDTMEGERKSTTRMASGSIGSPLPVDKVFTLK